MGFFTPDPEPSSSTFGSIDPSLFNAPIDWTALPFGLASPLQITPLSFPRFGAPMRPFFGGSSGNDTSGTSDAASPDQVAQTDVDRRNRCIEMCTAVTLALPPKFRAGTFEQCMAHCMGKGEFPQFEPIPFGGG